MKAIQKSKNQKNVENNISNEKKFDKNENLNANQFDDDDIDDNKTNNDNDVRILNKSNNASK